MKWYEGGIVDAIGASQKKSAIFLVYVEGSDDVSTRLNEFLENSEIKGLLESDKFVAIKIQKDGISHQQFQAIYANSINPCLYFIGKNGSALDIITEVNDVNELLKKIENVVSKNGGKENTAESTSNFISGEQSNQMPANVVCENGVCTIKREEPSSPSAEEKLARAKELLLEKQKQKEIEEKEKERLKEIERRKMGKDVQEMKRWQEDQELKQLKEERDREKKENQAARDRVLAQIAQDKAERASKFPSTSGGNSPVATTAATPQCEPKPAPKSDVARLQFKLPDGSSKNHDFPSGDKLSVVRDYVAKNLHLTCTNYAMSTTFPRREFTEADNEKSLLDLELTPNAVVLILPVNKGGTVQTNQGQGLMGIVWMVLSPIMGLLGFLKLFIFGGGNTGATDQAGGSPSTANSSSSRSTASKSTQKKDSTVKRRNNSSNIHRLTDSKDSDDENNTWNGNSTQQM
ncbi:unnamed protein product [Brassicogethes aeneus]|uniref:UBX domain-containing protein 4 n=1 Tax=Brassicogethes aeneus TaxID=1431903 RepID=A0A9P0AZJ1_BRAAE|nr:unnamed protein product [Brassicogethes aeneus]